MTDWVSVLTELIPLALVIALSPLSIIPAVLVLQSPHARITGLTFLAGWLVAIAVLTGVFVQLSGLMPQAGHPSTTASWVRIGSQKFNGSVEDMCSRSRTRVQPSAARAMPGVQRQWANTPMNTTIHSRNIASITDRTVATPADPAHSRAVDRNPASVRRTVGPAIWDWGCSCVWHSSASRPRS